MHRTCRRYRIWLFSSSIRNGLDLDVNWFMQETMQRPHHAPMEINELLVKKEKKANRSPLKGWWSTCIWSWWGLSVSWGRCSFGLVPGVTSLIAAPAYAPVTTTRYGYISWWLLLWSWRPNKSAQTIGKVLPQQWYTLLCHMGGNLPTIAENWWLMATTLSTHQWRSFAGDWTCSRGACSTLVTLTWKRHNCAPAIIVAGDVVNLRGTPQWVR